MGIFNRVREKVEEKVNHVKAKAAAVATAVCVGAAGCVACAEDAGKANEAVVSAMTKVAGDMTATATSILPIALGVVGLGLVVVFGIRLFKRISSKG